MAVSINVRPDIHLVITEFHGELRREDLLYVEDQIAASNEVDDQFNRFTILHKGLKFSITGHDLRAFGNRKEILLPQAERVFVAPDQLAYGFARMYASCARAITDKFRFFDSLEPACQYLGITVADLDQSNCP